MAVSRPKSAQEYHSDTTRLTSRMFWAPHPARTIVYSALLSLIGGLLISLPSIDIQILTYSVLLFFVPSLLTATLSQPLANSLGGKTYMRRTSLLALTGLVIAISMVALIRGVEVLYLLFTNGQNGNQPLSQFRMIALCWGPTLWVSLLVMMSTSDSRILRSLPSSSVQTISSYLLALVIFPFTSWDLVFAFLIFVIFLSSSILFAEIANRPMRKSFGYDGLWLMGKLLEHLTARGPAARGSVEGFFKAISTPAQVHLGVVAFGSPPKFKALIITPSAHPGPLGALGGSDLPIKLSNQLSDISAEVLTPKGPNTHDQNIATTEECTIVGNNVRRLLQDCTTSKGGSKLATANAGRATATAQFFGNGVLIATSLAPNPTDDIDSATGHATRQEAKSAGAGDAIFVDAHNCMEVGSGLTHFGSRASHDVIEASRLAVQAAMSQRVGTIRVGVASKRYPGNPDNGLGPMGTQVLVVEAGNQKAAYILFDGNNMVCGLRENIIQAVRGIVDVAEVLTSDDHAVNMTMGGFNPVGMKMDHSEIVSTVRDLTQSAVEDLSPENSVFATDYIDDLRIFGPESSARLTTTVNLTIAVLRPALVMTLTLATVLSLLALILVP